VLFGVGCAPARDEYLRTPAYRIAVYTHGQDVDLGQIDAAWTDVAACWHYTGSTRGVSVEIVEDWHQGRVQYFACQESPTGWCAGLTLGTYVMVPPDMVALRHEFSHLIGAFAGYATPNYLGKCWL
jgi:hypothetical protein